MDQKVKSFEDETQDENVTSMPLELVRLWDKICSNLSQRTKRALLKTGWATLHSFPDWASISMKKPFQTESQLFSPFSCPCVLEHSASSIYMLNEVGIRAPSPKTRLSWVALHKLLSSQPQILSWLFQLSTWLTWKDRTSVGEFLLLDWPVGMSMRYFLDFWVM